MICRVNELVKYTIELLKFTQQNSIIIEELPDTLRSYTIMSNNKMDKYTEIIGVLL